MAAPLGTPRARAHETERARTLERLGLAAVLLLAVALQTWRLTIDGYANGYYAEAALAAGRSWTALLTNAADPSGLIGLDKGPLPDWLLGLSARFFGFGSLSLLLPGALLTVATVLVLHDLVRRTLGRPTALLAALMLALTPVSVLMGRYDNPEPLLALLLTGSAWALVRALESGRAGHVILAGVLVGLGFETKMLEAYLILPALAGTYLLAAPSPLRSRLRRLAAGGAAMLAVSLAWYAAMALIPSGERPYVPQTSDDSWFSLIAQANGIDRLTGFSGSRQPGPLRLLSPQIAGQAGWLLPLALLGLLAGLPALRGAPRTERRRAALLLLGGWMVSGWALFSFSRGLFHPYYTSAIAPPVAALAACAVTMTAARVRSSRAGAWTLAAGLLGTGLLGWAILAHTPGFLPWLRWAVLAAGTLGALLSLGLACRRAAPGLVPLVVAGLAGALALLGGPAAYSLATVGFGRSGANPIAGPASLTPPRGRAAGPFDPTLVRYLLAHRGGARYVLAATGSDFAAPVGLATRRPVATLGGYDGSGAAPTVAQLAALVRSGQLRFVLVAAPQPSPASRRLARWVASACAPVTAVPLTGLHGENGSPLAAPARVAGEARAGLYGCPSGDGVAEHARGPGEHERAQRHEHGEGQPHVFA